MTPRLSTALVLAAMLIALGAAAVGYRIGHQTVSSNNASSPLVPQPTDPSGVAAGEQATRRHIQAGLKAGDTDPANGQRILYYHDPMVPGKRFEAPAKSPFMDMMLVPVYAEPAGRDGSSVTVSPRVGQNLGLRTALVEEGTLSPQLQAVGSIAWNERDQSVIQARATGYVETLHVRATLDPVRAGQPFAELFVPEWLAAQQEYLAIRRVAPGDGPLVTAARQRMQLLGMTDRQITQVEQGHTPQTRVTLTAPRSGVVVELVAREGMSVAPGMTLARIHGLSTVWALAEVPESQVTLVRVGTRVEARSAADPGTPLRGTVQAILPEVSQPARTLKVRVQLPNPGARLAPGMLVSMRFMDARARPALLVPTEAIIATGQRTVVMLAEGEGRYHPVNVETGLESEGKTEVRSGLQAGQRVVVSSQFLIDSEASLKGVEARLNRDPASAPALRHQSQGQVEAVDNNHVTLSHDPIPSLGWPAMTMAFRRPAAGLPRPLAVGDRVQFDFEMPSGGDPTLTRIVPLANQPAPRPGGAP